ncbi:MAG: hypothetical protein KY464_00160 [Gemmatimonadetes bacterium]|nr:hypothetical protein [Gemmatimonadota bacterium]
MDEQEQGMGGAANMPPFGRESMGRTEGAPYDYADEDETPLRARRRPGGPRERINDALFEMAERVQMAADRLGELADDRFGDEDGAAGRAGALVQDLAARLDGVADYLRSSDVDSVRDGLERQVREKPIHSVLIAVAAGWVAGKIIR